MILLLCESILYHYLSLSSDSDMTTSVDWSEVTQLVTQVGVRAFLFDVVEVWVIYWLPTHSTSPVASIVRWVLLIPLSLSSIPLFSLLTSLIFVW